MVRNLFSYTLFILVALLSSSPAFAMDREEFNKRLAVYESQMNHGLEAVTIEKARFCPQPRTHTTEECERDYEAHRNAIVHEMEIGIAYQREIFDHHLSVKAVELKVELDTAMKDTDRNAKITRDRYYIPNTVTNSTAVTNK